MSRLLALLLVLQCRTSCALPHAAREGLMQPEHASSSGLALASDLERNYKCTESAKQGANLPPRCCSMRVDDCADVTDAGGGGIIESSEKGAACGDFFYIRLVKNLDGESGLVRATRCRVCCRPRLALISPLPTPACVPAAQQS